MTHDPLAGPFPGAVQLLDYSDMPGYATTTDPEGTPSRARELREAAIGRWAPSR